MEDRELLELAAKAAGMNVLTVPWPRNPDGWFWCENSSTGPGLFKTGNVSKGWHPLTDDGDALRLAVALRIQLEWTRTLTKHNEEWLQAYPQSHGHLAEFVLLDGDRAAATRRAIVRAAAALATAPAA